MQPGTSCVACAAALPAGADVCARCGSRVEPHDRGGLPAVLAGCVPAGRSARAAAVVTDAVVLLLLGAATCAVVLLADVSTGPALAVGAGVVVVGAALGVVLVVRIGQTPGLRASELRSVGLFTGLPTTARDRVVLDVRAGRDPVRGLAPVTMAALLGAPVEAAPVDAAPAAPLAASLAAPLAAPSATPPAVQAASTVVVALDDGQRFEISGHALIGRNPAPAGDEEVDFLVPVNDLSRSVSKTHASLRWDGRHLWVADRGSTNGTIVLTAQGERSAAGADGVAVEPGSWLELGDRWVAIEAAAPGGAA